MKECAHSACDTKDHPAVAEINYEFLSAVAQALVYSIAELTYKPGRKTECVAPGAQDEAASVTKQPTQAATGEKETTTIKIVTSAAASTAERTTTEGSQVWNDVEFPGDNRVEEVDNALHAALPPMSNLVRTSWFAHQAGPAPPLSQWAWQHAPALTFYHLGTQVNIGNLTLNVIKARSEREKSAQLNSSLDDVMDEISNAIHGYYGDSNGKQLGKQSPQMLIKLLPEISSSNHKSTN
jgi:hypothetical protein